MQIQKHAIDLGNDSVGKLVVRLAVPAVIAQLINLLYNLVDRMYVGAIKDIGMEALAGLGVVFPITLIVSAFANLVGLGGAPLAGIFLGEKRRDKANEVFNAGIVMLAFFSVVLTALVLIFCEPLVRLFGAPANVSGYARDYLFVYGAGTVFVMVSLGLNPFITTQGYSLTSMLTVTIGAGLNIALDPLFIFVFGLGVRGAALATILSQAVSAVWVILFFSGKRSLFRFDFRLFRPKSAVMLKILLLGLSPFIMSVTESAIQIVFNNTLKYWSGENSNYTTALTVMLSAIQIISLPLNGLGAGVQPLISYNYGCGNSARVRKTVKLVSGVAFCYSFSVWLVSLFAPQIYGYLFSADKEVLDIIRKNMPFFMAGTVFFFAQMTLQNAFIALNQAKISIFLACLRKIILLIPLSLLLPYRFGAEGVFYSEGIADALAGITTATTFFLMLPRILKKREQLLMSGQNGAAYESAAAGTTDATLTGPSPQDACGQSSSPAPRATGNEENSETQKSDG